MIRIHDAFLDTEDFDFQINRQGIVQLSFGPTHVCMNLDSAYDLQYQLASFLAHLETKENEESNLPEAKTMISHHVAYKRTRGVDG